MINLPIDLQIEILSFIPIKCHSCYRKIDQTNKNIIIVCKKFYFCSLECYNFI